MYLNPIKTSSKDIVCGVDYAKEREGSVLTFCVIDCEKGEVIQCDTVKNTKNDPEFVITCLQELKDHYKCPIWQENKI